MISQVVDRYEVLREIGRGGMGLVYEVKDQRGYQRNYALKVMNPNVAAREDLVSRFLDEAKLLGELNDPNIVFAYDFWNTDDHTYLLMEFVQGGTLKELIQEKNGLPWEEALPLFEQVVSALSAAHEKNIIHRDIKPSNVLLHEGGGEQPIVKVTDFGLAKIQEEAASDSMARTMSHFGGGTLPYMPPEQILGLHRADKRSDVYALGLTLYTMLAGKNPFEEMSNSFTVQKAIVDHQFTPLHKAVAGVPKPLTRFVDKATAKDPDKRFADATEMLAELRGVRAALAPVAPTALSEAYEESDSAQRRRWPLVAAVGVILVGALAFFGIRQFSGEEAAPAASTATVSIYASPDNALISVAGAEPSRGSLENIELAPGETRVQAELDGYRPIDTLLTVERDSREFALVLQPAKDEAQEEPEETPELAAENQPDETDVRPETRAETPTPEPPPRQTATPEQSTPAARREAPARPGIVEAFVRPFGTIYVNDELLAENTNGRHGKELPPGTHRVRAEHPTYGTWTKNVRIEPGQTQEVSFNFGTQYQVTVTSEPSIAEVILDGQPTGRYTPTQVMVRPGERAVSVQKDGYIMDGNPVTFTLEEDRTAADPLKFTLRPSQ